MFYLTRYNMDIGAIVSVAYTLNVQILSCANITTVASF